MEFTGERYIPNQSPGREIEVEHMQRYQAVLPLVEGKVVLDAATGAGYGAMALAERAASVVGIDVSVEAIAHARKTYQAPNLRFETASIEALPLPDASVDRLVSFETIEHVDEAVQARFLDEAARVLKPDGLMIISSPDRRIYSERAHHANPFHLKEFDEPEFRAFLTRRFPHVHMFYQRFELACTLYDGRARELRVLNAASADRTGTYLVAICGREPFEIPDAFATAILDDGDHHHDLIQHIRGLEAVQAEYHRVVAEHHRLVADIRQLEREVSWLLNSPLWPYIQSAKQLAKRLLRR